MLKIVEKSTKDQKLDKIKEIIVNTMIDNYNAYGAQQNMTREEVQNLINTNMPGVTGMAEAISIQIYDSLIE